MVKIQELNIKNSETPYQEVVKALALYREEPQGSHLFVVEGTKEDPIVVLRYPGRKVRRRQLKTQRAGAILWANLYDFEVVPFRNGKPIDGTEFTFTEIMRDFEENKKTSEKFWALLEELYETNTVIKPIPKLPGVDPKLYLLVLKWIWIQEDFNYKFKWEEVGSEIPYVLETRTGTRTAGGAGRAKFFAALILLRNHFDFKTVKKIIPLF